MSSLFREEAVPLVTIESGQFKAHPEALEILRHIPAPIVVVGVAGLYRTGKSYLLNRIILNQRRGFGVASSVNACTKGIWMWGRPLKAQTERGEIVSIIVLDSEGLGALDQDSAHDCRIFALVLLLSSVFIYNSVGALDEAAIDSLSLVINLTKHIRVRAKNEGDTSDGEDDDSEEFAAYFPSFLWILRDFALQLVDEDGEALSARQYLEGALAQRPGLSDEVANKNRIRRLIQHFFRERDCFTLVRPLTEEEGLKRLDDIDLEQLRPEFVCQALELRKRITSLSRKKMLRGREVTGETLGSLLVSYIAAINGGAVPNIESAWTYICQQHTRVLVDGCVAEFLESARERIEDHMPLAGRALRQSVRELRFHVLGRFRRETMLAETDHERAIYEEEIKQRIKEAKQSLKADNEHEFESLFVGSLSANYNEGVYPRILDERISEAKEVVAALQELRRNFEQAEPDGPRKVEKLFRFLFARSCEAHTIVWKTRESRFQEKQTEQEARQAGALAELESQRSALSDDKRIISSQLEHTKKELHDTLFEKSKLEQQILSVREELSTLEADSNRRRTEERNIYKAKQDELVRKLEESERALRASESLQSKQKSEFDTQLALLNQQLEFYRRQETEWTETSSRLAEKHRKWEEETGSRHARAMQELEARLKSQTEELARLREQKQNFEAQLSQRMNAQESIFKDFEEKEDELRSFINTHERTILSLREQLRTKDVQTVECTETEQQLAAQVALLEEEIKACEQKLKAKDDRLQLLAIELDKEKTLNAQNTEFFNIKIADLTAEAEELKRLKDNALQALQNTSGVKSDLSRQLQELRTSFEERIKRAAEEFEAEREDLVQRLGKQAEEYELHTKEAKRDRETLLADKLRLEGEVKVLQDTVEGLESRVARFEASKAEALNEAESFYETKIARLEAEFEERLVQKNVEATEAQFLLEESLRNLQQTFESEKSRLERRLAEGKAKFDSLNKGSIEELERRHKEEIAALEEEVETLTVELQAQDLRARANAQKLENEVQVAKAKQDSMERKLSETKLSFEKDLASERSKIAFAQQSFEQERKALVERLDQQKTELSTRALEAFQLQQALESFKTTHARQTSEQDKTIAELLNEATELKARVETLIQDKYQLNDELILARTQLSKENALNAQKVEYLERRASDLARAVELAQTELDERLRTQRSEREIEQSKLRAGLQEELSLWEARYEEKKRSAKELEAVLGQKLADGERTRLILQEKLTQSELRREEAEKRLQIEVGRMEADLKRVRETSQAERRALVTELEQTRREKYELELSAAESTARFDKDRAVMEGKIGFLEAQTRKLRADLADSQSNFDSMFQKLHQFRVADKEETEQTHTSYIVAIEQRYSAQLTDLREQNKTLVETYKEKLRALEREVRRLEQTNHELAAQRLGSGHVHEKRVYELLENEKRLQDEIIRLKSELERSGLNALKEFEKERETLKRRIFETEARIKKIENERGLLLLEHEKQKTKWHIEKDQLLSQRGDTLEQIDRLQKQKESLTRENEKLKSDLKALKKTQLSGGLLNMTKMGNRSDLFSVDKSLMSPREYLGSNNQTGNSSGHD